MSLLSKIAKILGIAGAGLGTAATFGAGSPALAAALGGGGLLGKIGKVAEGVSPVLGGMSKAGAESKANEATYSARADQNNLERFKVNQALPSNRLNTAVRASRASMMQPAHINWGGPGSVARGDKTTITGGYNDNLVNADTRSLADDITHKMLMDQLNGVEAPTTSDYPASTGMDKLIGGGAAGSALMAALMAARKGKTGVIGTNMPTVPETGIAGFDPNSVGSY